MFVLKVVGHILIFFNYMLFYPSMVTCTFGNNHASSLCGAFVIYTSKNVERANAVLSSKNDHYAIGDCLPTCFIIQLCNKVKINCIELQNMEYLSSFPCDIKFSAYVDREWKDLGTFKCKFTRKKQRFFIETNMFVNILRIDILSFIGKHSFFTLTNIKVYGSTVVDNLNLASIDARSTDISNKLVNYKDKSKDEFGSFISNIRLFRILIEQSHLIFAGITGFFTCLVFIYILHRYLPKRT